MICVPVDLQIASYATSERDHLLALLRSVQSGDILVLDRGYPSHEILQKLTAAGIDFLIRVPATSTFDAIDVFRSSGGNDYRVLVQPPKGAPAKWKPLEMRAVKIVNDGTESYFLTSLQRQHFTRADLRELYHMRWEAEEFYKLMKSPYIGQGQFRSKSPGGIRQEIHALVLFLAITRFLMATAAHNTGDEYQELSQKAGTLGLAAYITRIFLSDDPELTAQRLLSLVERIVRTRDKKRPGRSFPRRSYKPRPRWGPHGRLRG